MGAAAAKNNKGCGVCPPQQVQSPRWREDSWPRAREASPKRAGAGRPAAGATGSPRSSPRKGLPWSTAAAPRGGRGKPGKWPGRRSSAARAGGLVGPVNRRCSSRGAFAQHGSQVPAVPPQGVKCRTRCMQSTNPPTEQQSRHPLKSIGCNDEHAEREEQSINGQRRQEWGPILWMMLYVYAAGSALAHTGMACIECVHHRLTCGVQYTACRRRSRIRHVRPSRQRGMCFYC